LRATKFRSVNHDVLERIGTTLLNKPMETTGRGGERQLFGGRTGKHNNFFYMLFPGDATGWLRSRSSTLRWPSSKRSHFKVNHSSNELMIHAILRLTWIRSSFPARLRSFTAIDKKCFQRTRIRTITFECDSRVQRFDEGYFVRSLLKFVSIQGCVGCLVNHVFTRKIGTLWFETDSRLRKLNDLAFLKVLSVRFVSLDQSTFLVSTVLAARRLNP
jgi:hypothetical protein